MGNELKMIKCALCELSPLHFRASLLMENESQYYFCGAYLFHFEMMRIAKTVNDSGLQLIRYEWFKQELSKLYQGENVSMKPALKVFFTHLSKKLPLDFFVSWIDSYGQGFPELRASFLASYFNEVLGISEDLESLFRLDQCGVDMGQLPILKRGHPLSGLLALMEYYQKQLKKDPNFFKSAFYLKGEAPSFIFYLLWARIKSSRLKAICSPVIRFFK